MNERLGLDLLRRKDGADAGRVKVGGDKSLRELLETQVFRVQISHTLLQPRNLRQLPEV